MRVGMGYDVHKLTENRKLILGGVEIPYEKGLLGHSDADVLLHAIMDALLGAAALGDIGKHFPDTDPAYKGASSIELLKHVGKLIDEKLYVIGNIDATIIAQRPKMAPHIEQMRKNVAEALHIDVDQVNIKATTEEGLVKSYFANPFGPAQKQEECNKLIEKYFNDMFDGNVKVGQIKTCLAIKGKEQQGPKVAALDLFEIIKEL